MNISDDQLAPVGGGSMRPVTGQQAAEPVGRFTVTRPVHPSEIWQPHSRSITPPDRPLTSRDAYAGAPSERPMQREYSGESGVFAVPHFTIAAQAARAAVRPYPRLP